MKHGFNIYGTIKSLAVLLAALWLAGCTRTPDDMVPPVEQANEVRITVSVPDTRTPSSTRSMDGDKEDEVKSIELLVFDASGPNDVYLQWVQGERVSQDFSEGLSTVTFVARLEPTENPARLVVVANHSIKELAKSFDEGETTKQTVMQALTYSTAGTTPEEWKWKADGSSTDGYTAIPMYAETTVPKIRPQMAPITGIMLTRMLARIDIVNNAPGFSVQEVYLANYNTAGYIAPAWNTSTGQVYDNPPADPMIPSQNGRVTGADNAILYEINSATSYVGEIYAYESPAAIDGSGNSATSRRDATCLIVKGTIGSGEPSYYRVDFTWNGDPAYMPLKRNYKYTINITEAEGVGYPSVAQAIESYTVLSNLRTKVISYDRNKVKNIVYNGQHMLGAGESNLNVSRYNETYTIDMFTDSPGGWKATITDNVWNDETWITFAGGGGTTATGAANTEYTLYMDLSYFPGNIGDSRTAKISVTADRLALTINVTQTITSEGVGTLKVIDENGNPIDRMYFPLNRDSEAEVEPQTIYAVWTGSSTTCQAGLRGSYSIQYENFTPMPGRGPGNETTLPGFIQAFTIQPKPGNPAGDYWRDDELSFALYDGSGKIAGQNVHIIQGNAQFNLEVDPSGYLLGNASYQIPLSTNMKWKVMSITATGATVEQLLGSGGDIQVDNIGADPGDWSTTPLTLSVAPWSYGVSGTLSVTFELEFSGFTFSKVYEIDINSSYMDYLNGTNNAARYYIWPVPFTTSEGITYMDYSTAQTKCAAIGTGWRVPTSSELQMSYAYVNALGGMNGAQGWFWPHYWSSSTIGSNYMTIYFDAGNLGLYPPSPSVQTTARCVYVNSSSSGTVYPYINTTAYSGGVLIVSRDGGSGVDAAALDSSLTPSGTTNKVAPKLLVANTNLSVSIDGWDAAKNACSTSMGTGWRLPTQREVYLIASLGGTAMEITNPGYGSDVNWPSGSRISLTETTWTMTEDGDNAWVFLTKGQNGLPGMISQNKTTDWPGVRCVKTITD